MLLSDDHISFRPWQGLARMEQQTPRSNSSSRVPTRPSTPQLVTTSGSGTTRAIKSHSTTHLPTVGTTAAAFTSSLSQPHDRSLSDNLDFNTLSRTPTPLSDRSRTPPSASSHHPDLSNEVAALSTKLINAINHQTNLDDSLQHTRGELDGAQQEITRLSLEVEDERQKRLAAEQHKRKLETEVEVLTSSLFEEANSMVASARRDHEEAEQRNEQLKAQLRDAETLLASHQEQLRELKDVLQQIKAEPGESPMHPSVPSTPIVGPSGIASVDVRRNKQSTASLSLQQLQPEHPLSFSHLIFPVLRSDTQSFDDFVSMLKAGKQDTPTSRTNSGNFAGLNVMGIGFTQSNITKSTQPANTSNSSLATSSPQPHSVPGAFHSPADAVASPNITSTLKDQKFYKRALTEDIEPTLRLDAAPGLSWLSRRNLIGSMVSGNLIVEPFGPSSRYWSAAYSCALCGESRDDEPYVRRHRFYKGDAEDAQRYMVCDYCLGRLRATGDFVNFLRMVRSGYWKADSMEDSRIAWEECTKLRERMFWARLGGGVLPMIMPVNVTESGSMHSPRSSRNVSADDQPSHAIAARMVGSEVPLVKPRIPGPGPSSGSLAGPGPAERLTSRPSSSGPIGRVSASGSPERRPDSSGSQKFLAARSRFESTSSDGMGGVLGRVDSNSRPSTPATAAGSTERPESEADAGALETPAESLPPPSPPKSPVKSMMPGSLDP